jgi:hypothetical protein
MAEFEDALHGTFEQFVKHMPHLETKMDEKDRLVSPQDPHMISALRTLIPALTSAHQPSPALISHHQAPLTCTCHPAMQLLRTGYQVEARAPTRGMES